MTYAAAGWVSQEFGSACHTVLGVSVRKWKPVTTLQLFNIGPNMLGQSGSFLTCLSVLDFFRNNLSTMHLQIILHVCSVVTFPSCLLAELFNKSCTFLLLSSTVHFWPTYFSVTNAKLLFFSLHGNPRRKGMPNRKADWCCLHASPHSLL